MDSYPDKWQTKKIEDIAYKPQYGYTASATVEPLGPKFLRITDIKDGHVNWSDVPYCLCESSDYNKYKLKQGDIVFARTGATTGKSYRIKEKTDSIFASYLIRIRTKKIVDSTYLSYVFDSDIYWRQINRLLVGSAQGGVNASVLSSLKVPVPPLVEQRGIVEVLGTVDECIRLTDAVIERAEELKRGLMQQLLTRGIGHTEYKETPLGEIPKTWKVEKIGTNIDLLTGFPFKSESYSSNSNHTKLLRGTNITEGKLRWYQNNTVYWGNIEDYSKFFLKENDVIIGMDGSKVGRNYAIIKKEDLPLLLLQRVARIRVNANLNSLFLYYHIGSYRFIHYVDRVKTSTAIPHISPKQIKDFVITLPPIEEQDKIVKLLSSIDYKLEKEFSRNQYYKSLKQGLMQILLSGKIRVELKRDGLHRIEDGREANN